MEHHLLEKLVNITEQGVWVVNTDGETIDVNPAMCRILGRKKSEILRLRIFDLVDERNRRIFEREMARRRSGVDASRYEIALMRPDGELVPCINNANLIRRADGSPECSIGIWTEITELKQTQAELAALRDSLALEVARKTEALQRNEARLKEAQNIARLGSWDVDAGGAVTLSPEAVELLGLEPGGHGGGTADFYRAVHPDDRATVRRQTEQAWAEKGRYETTYRVVGPDGAVRHMRDSAAVMTDEDGRPLRLSGVVQDVTEQVRADEVLRIAQRLESVGTLAGGMAHDFNNVLAIIVGSAEQMKLSEQYSDQTVDNIIKAALRGASLTHRMLAYARQQPLHARNFDVAALVRGLIELIDRTLGAGITVRLRFEEGLWAARADPGQVENAMINLAINARDAMPEGGDLLFDCANETLAGDAASGMSGEFVALSVTDTGTGMSPEVIRQATDPFFTTKQGESSGLGLSMVHGFASQSGGRLEILSEPGAGTTVRLLLPRARGEVEDEPDITIDSAVMGAGERILVIEDDPLVRDLVQTALSSLNYEATVAGGADEARRLVERGDDFDLVIADVMLPGGRNGPETVQDLRAIRPDLRTAFITGSPAVIGQRETGLTEDDHVILKPFTKSELAYFVASSLCS